MSETCVAPAPTIEPEQEIVESIDPSTVAAPAAPEPATKRALPTNPYSIVRDPNGCGPLEERNWVARMHVKGPNGPSFCHCGSFKTPEECQDIWDNDVPLNADELIAQGYDIYAGPKKPAAKAAPAKKTTKKAK